MNDAHFHMLVNHFPIIGTIFGFGILLVAFLKKNKTLLNTAFSLFIIAAVFAALSMFTGEGAEHQLINQKLADHPIIHEHEEAAEKLALVLYILGLLSISGIYMNLKNKAKANVMAFLIIIVAAIAILFATQAGTTGGEIRHTEIRETK
jgi:uncharacterized membrane protein